ncbi:MAG: hypothetical protein CVU57_25640 [Deltaproteobacteria bacterium HGW-Deltaproteobacteria-15]|nr:MAG: hypothetical protein CVU57_25640 [Deltaproteobacteria bacterium HGW-Deltaproteobacteria-15]
MMREEIKDRFRCLFGVAIGDALGAPFEHIPPRKSNQPMDRTGGRILDFHAWQNALVQHVFIRDRHLKAVNESFDRDTAGALAGGILGTYRGEDEIPEQWKHGVEDRTYLSYDLVKVNLVPSG